MGVPGLSRGLSPSSVSLRAWEELLHDLISFSVILQRWTGRTDTQEVGGPQSSVPQGPKGKTAVTHRALDKEQLPSLNLVS